MWGINFRLCTERAIHTKGSFEIKNKFRNGIYENLMYTPISNICMQLVRENNVSQDF